jgi:hypothetical protein
MISQSAPSSPSCRAIQLPHLEDLYAAPELAVLATLETNARVAVLALAAAHPELQDVPAIDIDALELHAATGILDAARTLTNAINRYRLAIVRADQRDQILPF